MKKENLADTGLESKAFNAIDATSVSKLPCSQACENNKDPILEMLRKELQDCHHVLEIGSGTGQHSVYFAPRLAHLDWQTSDVSQNHRVIQVWQMRYPAPNLHAPLAFDLTTDTIPISSMGKPYDAVFTANTLHIIAWDLVERLFELVGEALPANGKLIIYGPFNENGHYSSDSNRQFNRHLRERDSKSGIRNKEDIVNLATEYHLTLNTQYQMPANNQMLVFKKE